MSREGTGCVVSVFDVLDFPENDPEEAFALLFYPFSFEFGVELGGIHKARAIIDASVRLVRLLVF